MSEQTVPLWRRFQAFAHILLLVVVWLLLLPFAGVAFLFSLFGGRMTDQQRRVAGDQV